MFFYFFSGMTVGLAAGLSPGPLMALVIGETLKRGKYAGIKIALAPLVSDLPIIIASVIFSGLMTKFQNALAWVILSGGIYLLYLGWDIFMPGTGKEKTSENGSTLKKGIITNFLNPSPYLFWFTVGASSLVRMWGLNRIFPVIYIVGFYGCLVGSKIVIAILTERSRKIFKDDKIRWARYFMGIAIVFFGIKFLFDALRTWGLI